MKELTQSWLNTQCKLIPGIEQAVVFASAASPNVAACWPPDQDPAPLLVELAGRTAGSGTASVGDGPDGNSEDATGNSRDLSYLASPLFDASGQYGAVAVEVRGLAGPQRQAVLRLLRWGATWFDLLSRNAPAKSTKDRLINVVEMLASALEHERCQAASMAAANELASRLECTRVSVGFVDGRHAAVRAISNSATVETRSNLVRAVAAAMDEAIDQDATITCPPIPGAPPLVAFAQEVLFERNDHGPVCSTPLYSAHEVVGALTLEREAGKPFEPATVELIETAAALFGPILDLKARQDRSIILKLFDAGIGGLHQVLGPSHLVAKCLVLALVVLIGFFTVATGDYRVTARATVEGRVKRVVAAPQDGFIATTLVRAGDSVEEGQLLATLDERDLKLEQLKLESEYEQISKERRVAVGERDRSATTILRAQMKQARAQIDLVRERLARTQLTAPFAGVVVSGDLSQALGAPVSHGEVLFEVAPLDEYRVILDVDERDIGEIATRRAGQLALTGTPDSGLALTVTRVLPVSAPSEGSNYFKVEAELDEASSLLRPGMQGIAKIDVGERKLAWIWGHTLVDWVRLQLWRWSS